MTTVESDNNRESPVFTLDLPPILHAINHIYLYLPITMDHVHYVSNFILDQIYDLAHVFILLQTRKCCALRAP